MAAPSHSSLQPRKRPAQRRAQVTVEAILEATLQVLRREGVARFTTTRVAELAGVSVGTLYQYFPHKRALVAELVRQHMARIEVRLVAALDGGGSLQAQATRLVGAFVATKREHMATSLALRGPKQEADGARIVRQGMRRMQATLLDRWHPLVPGVSREALGVRVAILVAAVDGVAQFAIEEQPALLETPEFEAVLLGMTSAALGLPAGAPRQVSAPAAGGDRRVARTTRRPRTGS